MTSKELARHLSHATVAYQVARDEPSLTQLKLLASDAAELVRRKGEGTVDHIVLSSILKSIVADIPPIGDTLQQEGWHWLE